MDLMNSVMFWAISWFPSYPIICMLQSTNWYAWRAWS